VFCTDGAACPTVTPSGITNVSHYLSFRLIAVNAYRELSADESDFEKG
jgi:hypothetical protein